MFETNSLALLGAGSQSTVRLAYLWLAGAICLMGLVAGGLIAFGLDLGAWVTTVSQSIEMDNTWSGSRETESQPMPAWLHPSELSH